jgi:hypothetical protein
MPEIVSDETPEIVRKVVRWNLWKEVSVFDHKCDKLPAGMKFHKFKIKNTVEEQHAFTSEGGYSREVVCPYCGMRTVYYFKNIRKSG